MTSSTLADRLCVVRRRIRRTVLLHGLSATLLTIGAVTLAASLLDWLVHIDDTGLRLLLLAGVAAATATAGWRWLVRPLRTRLGDVDLALRIERRFPVLADRLASSVEFIDGQRDPVSGSPELQDRLIDSTLAELDRLSIEDVVRTRPAIRIATVTGGLALLLGVLVTWQQASAATALSRLFFLSDAAWPKNTQLVFLDDQLEPAGYAADSALQLAQGSTIELMVENALGRLPDRVTMQYQLPGGRRVSDQLRQTARVDARGRSRDIGVAQLTASHGPVRFRAVGGDDATPWYVIEVVPPLVVDQLQLTIHPPSYSGRPPRQLETGAGHVEGLVGSTIELVTRVNQPLDHARLVRNGHQPLDATIDEDGRGFSVEFAIDTAGTSSYWFDLVDQRGIRNRQLTRYDLTGIADQPPEVFFEHPAGNLDVTAEAVVPLVIIARDDLGLQSVRLHTRIDERRADAEAVVDLLGPTDDAESVTLTHELALEGLKLEIGSEVVIHADATDRFDLGEPHLTDSSQHTLRVVSADTKRDDLAARQARLLDTLKQALDRQRNVRGQVGELRVQLDRAGSLRRTDIDLLLGTELNQRQITTQLADPDDGLRARARGLLAELDHNRIDDATARQRLERIADELDGLSRDDLSQIDRELSRARRALEPDTPGQVAPALESAERHQSHVVSTLESLLGDMVRWHNRRELLDEAHRLVEQQQQLNRSTAELPSEILNRPVDQLAAQQRADLERLAGRQLDQARQLERFREQLNDAARDLMPEDSDAAGNVTRVAEQLDRKGTAGRMRDAAGQLSGNLVGQAGQQQGQILDELEQLETDLLDRPDSDAETLVKRIDAAADRLEQLRKDQEQLRKQSGEASDDVALKRLAREQHELARQVDETIRQLKRLSAEPSAESAGEAASRMNAAESQLDEGNADSARQQQQAALDQLDQARRQLDQARQQARESLDRERAAQVADRLVGLEGRQRAVITETRRLAEAHDKRGRWSRALLKSLSSLGAEQREIATETRGLAKQPGGAPIVGMALETAAAMMLQASGRLDKRQVDDPTVAVEKSARRRLELLLTAMKPSSSSSSPSGKPPEGERRPDSRNGSPGEPRGAITLVARLKILRAIQQDVLDRTAQLEAVRVPGESLPADRQRERDQLAGEQSRLAELASDLARELQQAQDDPGEPEAQP